jgi:exodeoxyribonuclease-3
VDSPFYQAKLAWYERLGRWLEQAAKPTDALELGGDYNVAPDDRDVSNPAFWAETVLCHPDVRRVFAGLIDAGLVDAFRLHHAEGGFFSWWDYRMLAFPKNDGVRIDHVLLAAHLAPRCTASRIDRDERKGKLPSDHAPVVLELE